VRARWIDGPLSRYAAEDEACGAHHSFFFGCNKCGHTPKVDARADEVRVPGGEAGIGFDDLRYSASLHRVIAPGGRAGIVALINPDDGSVETIGGFSTSPKYEGGHDFGVTSADENGGLIAATDRTSETLSIIDAKSKSIVSQTKLGAHPDYARFSPQTKEVWVTEPDAKVIEIFSNAQNPQKTGSISIENGPESLEIDAAHGRAYTHHWDGNSVAIDVASRAIVGTWPNGCKDSRGIAIDPAQNILFALCKEGKLSMLDATTGKIISSAESGSGFDVLGYDAASQRAYGAGKCGCIVAFSTKDKTVSVVGKSSAPDDTHCAVADDRGGAWFCSPRAGAIVRARF